MLASRRIAAGTRLPEGSSPARIVEGTHSPPSDTSSSGGTTPLGCHLEGEGLRREDRDAVNETRTFPLLHIQPALDVLCHADERRITSFFLYSELRVGVGYETFGIMEPHERT